MDSRHLSMRMVVLAAILLQLPGGWSPALGQGTDGGQAAQQAQQASVAPAAKPPAGPAPIRIGSLTLSGSLRLRFESWGWFDTPAAESSYNFGAALLRLSLGQKKDRYEWLVEGAAPLLLGLPNNSIAPAPQGQLGLGAAYYAANGNRDGSVFIKQAYLNLKGIGSDKASSLRIGRLEFNDGTEIMPADPQLATIKREHISQRLIGTFAFTHIGRSFDGLQYVRNAKAGNFTLLAARPTEGVFQLRGWRELDVDLYYGSFNKALKSRNSERDLRLFVLHYHDGRRVLKPDNRPQGVRAADLEKIRITTLGGHYIGFSRAGSGRVDYLVWGAAQFGDWGKLTHRGAALALETGYQFGGPAADKFKPWVRAGYFRSTGDGDPSDGTHGTFFQVLPTPRFYARFPFYDLINNEDFFLQFRVKPHARLSLRTDLHQLRLSDSADQWYLGGGAFQRNTFGYTGRPSSGRKGLGTMFDLSLDFTINPQTALTFYIAGVRGGDVVESIYPAGSNSRYAYLELTRRF